MPNSSRSSVDSLIPPELPKVRSTSQQRRALGAAALVAVLALLWIAKPVGTGLLLGGLVGFSLQSLQVRLRHRWGSKTAALICTLGSTTALSALVFTFGYVMIARGIAVILWAPSLLESGTPLRAQIERLEVFLVRIHVSADELALRLQQEAVNLGSEAIGLAANLLTLLLYSLLTLFFTAIATYFVLQSWERLALAAEVILPIHPRHTRIVFAQLRDVGRHVFLGTLTTALVQGTLAGLGFWVCGVPQPAFFGVLASVASLLPAVGTLLVWAPLGVYLMLIGSTGAGVALLIYSVVVVVGFSDYVLRPYLVGDNELVPTLLTFVALFGGVEVFGLRGLVVGPIVVTLAVALLRTYHAEMSSLIPQEVAVARPSTTPVIQIANPALVVTRSEFIGHGGEETPPNNDPA